MKLNLPKPCLVVTVGVAGSGKTYFANYFSKIYDLPLISSALTTEILFEKPNFSDEESALVKKVNTEELVQLLKTKCTVIYDGFSNTRVARYDLTRLANQHNYDIMFVWVQTDEPTSLHRAIKNGMDQTRFEKLASKFTPLNERERHIVISGKRRPNDQLKNVISNILPRV